MGTRTQARGRPKGILVVAFLMILFGVAEALTSFSGNFLGVISTSPSFTFTFVGALAGAFYVLGGLCILTLKKWGAALGIACIGAEILGRTYLVVSGLFLFNGNNEGSIITGTVIAVGFAIYIGLRWEVFS